MTGTIAETAAATPVPASETAPHRALSADRTVHQDDDQPREETRGERALRVSQVDADEMDSGLIHMLNAKISRALSVFGVSVDLLKPC